MSRRSNELDHARDEMRAIIRELRTLANGIEREFLGIGQNHCAQCLRTVANFYERTVLTALENMRLNLAAKAADALEDAARWVNDRLPWT